jgi:hypothetical protein
VPNFVADGVYTGRLTKHYPSKRHQFLRQIAIFLLQWSHSKEINRGFMKTISMGQLQKHLRENGLELLDNPKLPKGSPIILGFAEPVRIKVKCRE